MTSALLLDILYFLFRMKNVLDAPRQKTNKQKNTKKHKKNYGLELWVVFGTRFYFQLNKDPHVAQASKKAFHTQKEKI